MSTSTSSRTPSNKQPTNDPSRRWDLVLFGATGFTGGLVAEVLSGHPDREKLRWALAGRSIERLEAVRDALRERQPGMPEIDLVVADSADADSLRSLAESTRVVCTTVGPYARYGSGLVEACAAAGTHYCDLAGETQWIRRMIDTHHATATASGARIVHCCGFDAIPSDIGTFALQAEARRAFDAACGRVLFCLRDARGGFSGGTVASMMNLMDEAATSREVRRQLVDPYSLNPEGDRSGADPRDGVTLRFDKRADGWLAPFIMAAINTRVVRRTHALLGWPWGRDFRYEEAMSFPRGARGAARATALAGGFAAGFAALSVPFLRKRIERRLPSPGEGPTREQMERGRFTVELIGEGRTADGRTFEVRTEVSMGRDPGYSGTAVMLAESALCLALDTERLPDRSGMLTPATGMGDALVERLRNAGMTVRSEASMR